MPYALYIMRLKMKFKYILIFFLYFRVLKTQEFIKMKKLILKRHLHQKDLPWCMTIAYIKKILLKKKLMIGVWILYIHF